MHSHSFQATKFKLHWIVNESPGQVVEGFTILPHSRGVRNKRVNHSKNVILDVQSPSFQVKKFKLHRIVNVSSRQVVEGFAILPYFSERQK